MFPIGVQLFSVFIRILKRQRIKRSLPLNTPEMNITEVQKSHPIDTGLGVTAFAPVYALTFPHTKKFVYTLSSFVCELGAVGISPIILERVGIEQQSWGNQGFHRVCVKRQVVFPFGEFEKPRMPPMWKTLQLIGNTLLTQPWFEHTVAARAVLPPRESPVTIT